MLPTTMRTGLDAYKDRVLRVAFQAKLENGWCDDGFNRAMTQLGFRPVVNHYIEAVYGPVPEDQPEPTPRNDYSNACGDLTCGLCYINPLTYRGPLLSGGVYEYRYADGDEEPVTFADGSKPSTEE